MAVPISGEKNQYQPPPHVADCWKNHPPTSTGCFILELDLTFSSITCLSTAKHNFSVQLTEVQWIGDS